MSNDSSKSRPWASVALALGLIVLGIVMGLVQPFGDESITIGSACVGVGMGIGVLVGWSGR